MRNLRWWQAWWTMEPRGGERGDYQAALLALPHAKEESRLIDILRILWDQWNPPDRNEKARRRIEKRDYRKRVVTQKAKAMMREVAADAAKVDAKKKGVSRGKKHRDAEREGDA